MIEDRKKRNRQYASNIGMGIALGVALGAAMGNIALGIALGTALGGISGLFMDRRARSKHGQDDDPAGSDSME